MKIKSFRSFSDVLYESVSVIEAKKSISHLLIGIIWNRLAKQGITNADDLIGTSETIDNVDFDKFWSNVTKEDIQYLKNSFELQRQDSIDLYDKFKGEFDPSTGTFASDDTSFFDNIIKAIDIVSKEIN